MYKYNLIYLSYKTEQMIEHKYLSLTATLQPMLGTGTEQFSDLRNMGLV